MSGASLAGVITGYAATALGPRTGLLVFGLVVVLNGHPTNRLPNTLNVSFVGCVGAEILAAMPEVAASTGSACHSGRIELSPVLEAMGVVPEAGMGAIRFSLGRSTTEAEADAVALALATAVPGRAR